MREARLFIDMENLFVASNPSLDNLMILIKADTKDEAENTAQVFMDKYLDLLNVEDREGIMPFIITDLDESHLFNKFSCSYVIEMVNDELTPSIDRISFSIDNPGIIRIGAEIYG